MPRPAEKGQPMCGIAGAVDLRRENRIDPTRIPRMTAMIAHRGPDGDGFHRADDVHLGMRRLSIIDVAGSDQPLYNEDRSIALVFNGEIYNYRELQAALRQHGHTYHTDGDGEMLAHLYEQYGLDLFRHVRGMYAFALWDAPRQRLVLAVDHIGMKPLYLYEADGLLYFASEIKALCAAGAVQPGLNWPVVDSYLRFGYPIGEATLFEGVRRLLPGHVLIAEKGTTRTERYWQFGRGYTGDALPITSQSEAEIIAQTRHRLEEAVTLHLRSDVPVGLFLSGGVDSAAMLALMHAQQADINTYTVGFEMQTRDNELGAARRIAAHFGTEHHEVVLSAQDWWRGLVCYAYHHDEPNANPSAISLLLLAERTAQDVKVVLTGLGGDELFYGYPAHRLVPGVLAWQQRLRVLPGREALATGLAQLERYYPALKRYRVIGAIPTYAPRLRHALLAPAEGLRRIMSFDGMVFSDGLAQRLYAADLRQAASTGYTQRTYETIVAASQRDDLRHFAQALQINTWLMGNALLSQDKVSMAHSLEARVPFFDPALLDWAARLPPDLALRRNKHILREALRPLLPDFALNQPKQPFSTPIRDWLQHELRTPVQDVLLDTGGLSRELFQSAALESLLGGHFSGSHKQEAVMFRLLNLELWHHAFVRQPRWEG